MAPLLYAPPYVYHQGTLDLNVPYDRNARHGHHLKVQNEMQDSLSAADEQWRLHRNGSELNPDLNGIFLNMRAARGNKFLTHQINEWGFETELLTQDDAGVHATARLEELTGAAGRSGEYAKMMMTIIWAQEIGEEHFDTVIDGIWWNAPNLKTGEHERRVRGGILFRERVGNWIARPLHQDGTVNVSGSQGPTRLPSGRQHIV